MRSLALGRFRTTTYCQPCSTHDIIWSSKSIHLYEVSTSKSDHSVHALQPLLANVIMVHALTVVQIHQTQQTSRSDQAPS
eukprot:6079926-Pleurochrysis_carterae.AAC.1